MDVAVREGPFVLRPRPPEAESRGWQRERDAESFEHPDAVLHLRALRVAVAGDEDLGDDVLLQNVLEVGRRSEDLGKQAIVHGLVIEAQMTEHASMPALVPDLEARVAAKRTDAHDEYLSDRDFATMEPARRRAQPEDARQSDENEAIQVAANRVGRNKEPERSHHGKHCGEQDPRQDHVAGECPTVPDVVVPEDPSAEHPHEHRARRHAEEDEPVPGLTSRFRGGRARREQDDAVADEVQILCGLLGHLTGVETARANERGRSAVASRRPITLGTTQCGRVQIGEGDSGN